MPTLCSMLNETGNRNMILEMCKFWIWIRLGPQFFTDFHQILRAAHKCFRIDAYCLRQTGNSLTILEVCGLRFRQFSGSGDHIFQHISTKSHVQIKFSNADLVFNGE